MSRPLLKLLVGASCAALVAPGMAFAQADETRVSADARPQPKSYELDLPLVRSGQVYGNVHSKIWTNGTVLFRRKSMLDELRPLLNDEAYGELSASLGNEAEEYLTPVELLNAGIVVKYDAAMLQIDVIQIDPGLGVVQTLGMPAPPPQPPEPTLKPQNFSAYANFVVDTRYSDLTGDSEETATIFGAARWNNVVLEFDGGYQEIGPSSGFYRRTTRLSYDDREARRRYSLGDLRLNSLDLLGGAFLGGVAIEHGRSVFNPFQSVFRTGQNELRLDQPATVEVFADGQLVDTLVLDPGRYDVSQLPLTYGSNNLEFIITDSAGRTQVTDLDLFSDPYDLAEGESEYNAAIGYPIEGSSGSSPDYADEVAFAGYFRHGVTNRVILGGALQASNDLTTVAGEASYFASSLPVSVEVSGAVSQTEEDTGHAARVTMNFYGDGDSARRLSFAANYESAAFRTIADTTFFSRQEALTINAAYSQAIGPRTMAVAGLTKVERGDFVNEQSVYGELFHTFANDVRVSAGLEYGEGRLRGEEVGVRVSLSKRFGARTSGSARYNSRREQFAANFSRSMEERVGSFGYDIGLSEAASESSASFNANYTGNRFEGRGGYLARGESFDKLGDENVILLQAGTSVAIAGGEMAIGRPIADSFVIAKPHESLESEQAVLGSRLQGDGYEAASGWFGPALKGDLYSFGDQSVQYDFWNTDSAIDIGTGVASVNPPYRSGYLMVVGSDAHYSVVGTLYIGEEQASLVAGQIVGVDDEDFQPQPFFTNSVGRFAMMGLRPGKTYRVTLTGSQRQFTIEIPKEGPTMIHKGKIVIPAQQVAMS